MTVNAASGGFGRIARLATVAVIAVVAITDTAYAGQWIKRYHVDYTLGDNDNRTEARKIAINKLRMLAAEDAGRYVQGDEALVNGKYAKGIHMATAAIVSVDHVRESMTVNAAGQPVLRIVAVATVDDTVLKNRIIAIQHDTALARKLADEDARVAALFDRMSELNGKLAAAKETAKIYRLMGERVRVEADMQSVFNQSRLSFGRGYLKAIADKNELQAKKQQAEREVKQTEQEIIKENMTQKRIAWLEKNFYQQIIKNTTLHTKIKNVTKSEDGYDINVAVGWNTHTQCPKLPVQTHNLMKGNLGYRVILAVGEIATIGLLAPVLIDIEDQQYADQLKSWRKNPKFQKNPVYYLGGCEYDHDPDWSLAKGFVDRFNIYEYQSYEDAPAVQYLHNHTIVIKLSFLPDHTNKKYIPIFDGKYLRVHSHVKNEVAQFYEVVQFHVSKDEINSIDGVEASMIKQYHASNIERRRKPRFNAGG